MPADRNVKVTLANRLAQADQGGCEKRKIRLIAHLANNIEIVRPLAEKLKVGSRADPIIALPSEKIEMIALVHDNFLGNTSYSQATLLYLDAADQNFDTLFCLWDNYGTNLDGKPEIFDKHITGIAQLGAVLKSSSTRGVEQRMLNHLFEIK